MHRVRGLTAAGALDRNRAIQPFVIPAKPSSLTRRRKTDTMECRVEGSRIPVCIWVFTMSIGCVTDTDIIDEVTVDMSWMATSCLRDSGCSSP